MTSKIILLFIFSIYSGDTTLNSLLARGKHYNESEINYIESKGYTWVSGRWVAPTKGKYNLSLIADAPSLRN